MSLAALTIEDCQQCGACCVNPSANAASVARMVLTTETAIVDKPAEEEDHGHGHGHHGHSH